MTSQDVIKIIEKDGWRLISKRGSHCQFKHSFKKGRVTVPHPKKDLPIGTINSILKQAGLKEIKV
jgi:predicted RNA binding protein YcfA (HicA-like mRNA interferase family)